MSRQPFRAVWHLLLTIDFGRVDRGEIVAPWVNQASLDFQHLRDVLQGAVNYPRTNVRVANDTIDLLTIRARHGAFDGADATGIRCLDFANALRMEAEKQKGTVIDVSHAWAGLHSLSNRAVVPPPMLLPLVIEADDEGDLLNAWWSAMAALSIASPLERIASAFRGESPDIAREDGVGVLPEALRREIESLFGIDYDPSVILDDVSVDTLPAGA
ncbi:hypothetical protein [Halomonas sp. C05BenzN]|uniref:hypothetical protein n=1 Tax=Halomonas sp. C05BenzN TaxID=3411041 RepID=UPI003B950EC0